MIVTKGLYSADTVERELEGKKPDESIHGIILDNYFITGDVYCTIYIETFKTAQSLSYPCYEIIKGLEEEMRLKWDDLKKKAENMIKGKET